jgi:hypothetical protein
LNYSAHDIGARKFTRRVGEDGGKRGGLRPSTDGWRQRGVQ